MSSSSRNQSLINDWRKPIKPLTPDRDMRQSYYIKPLPPVPLFMTEQQSLTKGYHPAGHNVSAWKPGNKEYDANAEIANAANTLVQGYHANSKKRANSSNSAERAKNAKLRKIANGGQINIYTGPKNGKYIIKNGVKVYINSKSLTNNVQYKKKSMPKKK